MNRFLLSAASAVVATMIASGASANTLYFQMNPNELSGPRQAFVFGAPNSTGSVTGSGGFSQDFNLGVQGFAIIDVPIAQQLAAGVVENKGFRISSDASLSAYFLSRAPATTDMSYLIDGARLGTDHVVTGYRNIRPDQISVQATVDNTVVTFSPKGAAAFDVTLNAGQTYMYAASAELTGSRVTSTNPIAVFSGNQCSNIPSNNTACDHIVEQMPAVNLLSTNYLVAQTPRTGSSGNVLRIVATENATEVRINGAMVATLDSGQFYEGRVVGGQEIIATKKVLVAEYLIGTTQAGAVTDPAMTIVPGSDQWLSSYVFATPSGSADFPNDSISIIMRTSDIGTLTIDGILADPSAFNPLASTAFSFGDFDVSAKSGPFSISAASPFQLLLSGFASADSYFTYGGAAFSPGASPPPDEPPPPPPPPPTESVFWDGSNATNADNGIVDGGDGIWDVSATTFTLDDGASNNAYPDVPPTVVFAGAAGTVTVDNELGQVQSSGMTFTTDGYVITGDPIELVLGTGDGDDGEGGGDGDGDGDGEGGGDGDGEGDLLLLSLMPTAVAISTDADVTATIESDLFGDVDVDKLGLGTLVLSGDNSFLNFRISEGTAAIGSNTGAGDGTITIANDATLAAGGPDVTLDNPVVTEGNGLVDAGPAGNVFTLDGNISGPGSISQVGMGNLVLNGDNSYTNLGINRGTVTFGSDTAGGIGGIAINNGTTLAAGVSGLVVTNDIETTGAGTIDSGSGVFTLSGSIGNVGSINKIGSGELIVTGDNDYAGPTTVTAGTLEVNGNNGTSVVTVLMGATLGGNGTVGSTNVLAGGTISPGNSIGQLTVNGNLNQLAASIYDVELGTSGVGDRIVVGGAATISNARVNVINTTGSPFALGSKWLILQTNGGVTGAYVLTGDNRVSQFIEVVGLYEPKNAYLTVNQTSSFVSAADTPNQFGSAIGSDTPANGALYQAIAYLPNEAAAQDAFDQTSGELHASLRSVSFEDSRFVREAIYNHNRQAVDPRIGLWVAGFGSWGAGQDDGNAARVDRSIGGFFLGVDALKSDTAALGIMTGYSTADINVNDRNSHASTDDLYVGIYGNYDVAGFSLTGAVTNTWRWVGTRRNIAFEGFQDSVRANYLINVFQAFGEAAYQFRFSGIGVEPFASFAYVSVDAKPFSEFGGTAALYADDNNNDDYWTTLLGLRVNYGLPINGDTFSLQASAGWRYVFEGDTLSATNLRFGQGPDFTVYGTPIAQNAIATSFTIQTKLTDRADMDIGYSGQYGDGWNDSGVRASLRLRF